MSGCGFQGKEERVSSTFGFQYANINSQKNQNTGALISLTFTRVDTQQFNNTISPGLTYFCHVLWQARQTKTVCKSTSALGAIGLVFGKSISLMYQDPRIALSLLDQRLYSGKANAIYEFLFKS